MADITMCGNAKDCPVKHVCYRFTATPDEYQQAYADFYNGQPYGCDNYFKR